jgi:hypothetical protein
MHMKQASMEARMCLGTLFVELKTAERGALRMLTSFDCHAIV